MPSTIRGSDNFDTAGGNAVKAWVNFNGTGTVAIRASFNVSSITDNGTGDYTVNFTNALVDSNYAPSYGAAYSGGSDGTVWSPNSIFSANALRIQTGSSSIGSLADLQVVAVAIHR